MLDPDHVTTPIVERVFAEFIAGRRSEPSLLAWSQTTSRRRRPMTRLVGCAGVAPTRGSTPRSSTSQPTRRGSPGSTRSDAVPDNSARRLLRQVASTRSPAAVGRGPGDRGRLPQGAEPRHRQRTPRPRRGTRRSDRLRLRRRSVTCRSQCVAPGHAKALRRKSPEGDLAGIVTPLSAYEGSVTCNFATSRSRSHPAPQEVG